MFSSSKGNEQHYWSNAHTGISVPDKYYLCTKMRDVLLPTEEEVDVLRSKRGADARTCRLFPLTFNCRISGVGGLCIIQLICLKFTLFYLSRHLSTVEEEIVHLKITLASCFQPPGKQKQSFTLHVSLSFDWRHTELSGGWFIGLFSLYSAFCLISQPPTLLITKKEKHRVALPAGLWSAQVKMVNSKAAFVSRNIYELWSHFRYTNR